MNTNLSSNAMSKPPNLSRPTSKTIGFSNEILDAEAAMWRNLLLLGFESNQFGLEFYSGMFQVPNSKAGVVILRFLFPLLQSETSIKDIIMYDSRSLNEFRKKVRAQIMEYEEKGFIPPVKAVVSTLANCHGEKFVTLLLHLTIYELRENFHSLFPSPSPSPSSSILPRPPHLINSKNGKNEMMENIIKGKIFLQMKAFSKTIFEIQSRKKLWREFSEILILEQRQLSIKKDLLEKDVKDVISNTHFDFSSNFDSLNSNLINKINILCDNWNSLLHICELSALMNTHPIQEFITSTGKRTKVDGKLLLQTTQTNHHSKMNNNNNHYNNNGNENDNGDEKIIFNISNTFHSYFGCLEKILSQFSTLSSEFHSFSKENKKMIKEKQDDDDDDDDGDDNNKEYIDFVWNDHGRSVDADDNTHKSNDENENDVNDKNSKENEKEERFDIKKAKCVVEEMHAQVENGKQLISDLKESIHNIQFSIQSLETQACMTKELESKNSNIQSFEGNEEEDQRSNLNVQIPTKGQKKSNLNLNLNLNSNFKTRLIPPTPIPKVFASHHHHHHSSSSFPSSTSSPPFSSSSSSFNAIFHSEKEERNMLKQNEMRKEDGGEGEGKRRGRVMLDKDKMREIKEDEEEEGDKDGGDVKDESWIKKEKKSLRRDKNFLFILSLISPLEEEESSVQIKKEKIKNLVRKKMKRKIKEEKNYAFQYSDKKMHNFNHQKQNNLPKLDSNQKREESFHGGRGSEGEGRGEEREGEQKERRGRKGDWFENNVFVSEDGVNKDKSVFVRSSSPPLLIDHNVHENALGLNFLEPLSLEDEELISFPPDF